MAEANSTDEILEEKVEELDEEEEVLARHRKEKKDIQGSVKDFQRNYIVFLRDIFLFFLFIVIYSNS
jgi:hypothetical protein